MTDDKLYNARVSLGMLVFMIYKLKLVDDKYSYPVIKYTRRYAKGVA